jgi:hypothetical protein
MLSYRKRLLWLFPWEYTVLNCGTSSSPLKKLLGHQRVSLGVITVSFLLTLAAPVRAETVALYCSWPNDIASILVDVDYATRRVTTSTAFTAGGSTAPVTSVAQITNHDITWSFPSRSGLRISYRINRLTGDLSECGGYRERGNPNCSDVRHCVPRKPQF